MLTEEGGLERLQHLVDSSMTMSKVRTLAQNVLNIVNREIGITEI